MKDLETLRDFPPTEQIKEIQQSLVILQNRDEPTKYELEYRSLNPRDAQTVLATVVSTYEKHLDELYQGNSADTMELLTKMADGFDKDVRLSLIHI